MDYITIIMVINYYIKVIIHYIKVIMHYIKVIIQEIKVIIHMAIVNHFIIINIEVTEIKDSIKRMVVKVTSFMDMVIIKESKLIKFKFMVVTIVVFIAT